MEKISWTPLVLIILIIYLFELSWQKFDVVFIQIRNQIDDF